MDIKELHDACRDAGINMRDEDSGDCYSIALELVFKSDYFHEQHIDWIADELVGRTEDKHMLACRERWSRDMGEVHKNLEGLDMLAVRNSDMLKITYASSLMYRISNIGEIVVQAISSRAEEYVDKYIDEWWADVQSYAGDMEAGAEEDYYYEQYRDRQMEERE